MEKYDYRGCQSLFGYAQEIHEQSGGVCQLCGAGNGNEPDFDFWRQLTVEHLIGESQGGEYRRILKALQNKFPEFNKSNLENCAWQLEKENMVSACAFCNSTTSRDKHEITMEEIIGGAGKSWHDVHTAVRSESEKILGRKRKNVAWKLESIREQFNRIVRPKLVRSRKDRNGT